VKYTAVWGKRDEKQRLRKQLKRTVDGGKKKAKFIRDRLGGGTAPILVMLKFYSHWAGREGRGLKTVEGSDSNRRSVKKCQRRRGARGKKKTQLTNNPPD